jgi:hypothetical protein
MAEMTLAQQPNPASTPSFRRIAKRTQEIWIGIGQFALVMLAWVITRTWTYTPGSEMGYNLGLVGGIMMLILLVYPMRKRIPMMRGWGNTRPWFLFHMTMGLCGPVLILAHTRFHFGSLNAAVALWSMLLVAGSGIIGRYIYVAIHHGLTGQRLGLGELQREAGFQGDEVHSRLAFAPEVEVTLRAFEASIAKNSNYRLVTLGRFLIVGFQARVVAARAHRMLKIGVRRQAALEGWDSGRQARRLHNGRNLIDAYLTGVLKVARFNTWVQLFSLWHVAHVPLVYALAVTAAAHVVAVHMY